jgi:hypothetical protein
MAVPDAITSAQLARFSDTRRFSAFQLQIAGSIADFVPQRTFGGAQ